MARSQEQAARMIEEIVEPPTHVLLSVDVGLFPQEASRRDLARQPKRSSPKIRN
jgi:hypothetical protein